MNQMSTCESCAEEFDANKNGYYYIEHDQANISLEKCCSESCVETLKSNIGSAMVGFQCPHFYTNEECKCYEEEEE